MYISGTDSDIIDIGAMGTTPITKRPQPVILGQHSMKGGNKGVIVAYIVAGMAAYEYFCISINRVVVKDKIICVTWFT